MQFSTRSHARRRSLFLVRRMSSTVAASQVITRHRVWFFLAGVLIPAVSLWIGFLWPRLYEWLFREGFSYAWQPLWYRIAGDIIGYLPLLTLGFLIALRVFDSLGSAVWTRGHFI